MFNPKVSRLEIDVLQANELADASDLTVQFKMSSMIVHTQLVQDALYARARKQGQYKIIIPVDWPKGENYGTMKLRGLSLESINIDGFEFMLTPHKSQAETANELNNLSSFVNDYLGSHIEIRYVIPINLIDDANFDTIASAMCGIRTPKLVRLDNLTKTQASKASIEIHNANISKLKAKVGFPIKISGNITAFEHIDQCDRASRFAVSLQQAKTITKESLSA